MMNPDNLCLCMRYGQITGAAYFLAGTTWWEEWEEYIKVSIQAFELKATFFLQELFQDCVWVYKEVEKRKKRKERAVEESFGVGKAGKYNNNNNI